ncbi:PDGLE domain-containing protein [Amycolatopsis anabasis]|uniref:PDGLE domain-containing protein n=1 Tax=Amycolatopsis anabasis TaxID=1840409 RepID=UPI00131EB1D1|nr:PDGLE domain-containing protein [Amycolatopsis anabasis]
MSPARTHRGVGFFAGFAIVALLLAGVVSYFADSSPDGLDSVTQDGCTTVQTAEGERLQGSCLAQDAREHPLEKGPLAGYAVGGDEGLTGVAGVLGVLATLAVAGGVFWLLRRRRAPDDPESRT